MQLTNTFHVAVRLFSNRSQMTSKCGKKKWHTRRSRVCHWCSYHILTSSVIYFWIRRTATWNLFVLYNKPFFFISKYSNITWKPAFCPAFAPPWRDLRSFQNEGISLVAMCSKELWLVEKTCATVKPDSSVAPRWMTTFTAKAELNCKIYKSWRKCWKNQVSFCHWGSPVSRKAWTLSWKLQELKKKPRKTCGYGQPRGHLIRVLNERSVIDSGAFCLQWLVILNQLDIVSETHFSNDTVDLGLWLAILNSLLCPETDRNIRIEKQGYVFYFTDFKKWCLSTVVLTLGKVEFFK